MSARFLPRLRRVTTAALPLVLLLAAGLISGCATAGPRTITLESTPTKYVAHNRIETASLSVELSDQRSDRSIDSVITGSVADAANSIIRQAATDSKLLQIGPGNVPRIEIKGELTKLDWVVPDYQAMLKKVFAASFLTGGLGGLAYGSTETPVQGNALLKLRVLRAGQEILQREYAGFHEEKLAKLKCDTIGTKSRVAGLALANAVDKFIADFDAAMAEPTKL